MTTDKNNSPVTAPMWWDGGDRAITAREKARIEEHGPSCFSIALVPATDSATVQQAPAIPNGLDQVYKALDLAADGPFFYVGAQTAAGVGTHFQAQPGSFRLFCGDASFANAHAIVAALNWLRENREALTATCKQPLQLGEVQGDVLAAAARAVIAAHDGPDFITDAQVEALRAALAARQPGVQEPVAWRYHAEGDATKWYYSDTASLLGLYQPLYAAPPAQGIDLGQFLPHTTPVIDKRQDVMATHGFAVPVRVISDAFRTALNEQRDAAPGVDRG